MVDKSAFEWVNTVTQTSWGPPCGRMRKTGGSLRSSASALSGSFAANNCELLHCSQCLWKVWEVAAGIGSLWFFAKIKPPTNSGLDYDLFSSRLRAGCLYCAGRKWLKIGFYLVWGKYRPTFCVRSLRFHDPNLWHIHHLWDERMQKSQRFGCKHLSGLHFSPGCRLPSTSWTAIPRVQGDQFQCTVECLWKGRPMAGLRPTMVCKLDSRCSDP